MSDPDLRQRQTAGFSEPCAGWRTPRVVLLALAIAGCGAPSTERPAAVRTELPLPAGVTPLTPAGLNLDVSPDGSRVALVGISLDRSTRIWEWRDEAGSFAPLDGTEAARNPTYSPDGRSLAFTVESRLFTMALDGSPADPIVAADSVYGSPGIDWGPDDELYYQKSDGRWWSVRAAGGAPEPVPGLGVGLDGLLDVLPGGAVLYTRNVGGPAGDQLGLRLPASDHTALLDRGAMARYAPSGHLLYTRGSTLFAQSFDQEELRRTGPAVEIATGVHVMSSSNSYFAVSRGEPDAGTTNGTLVYLTAGAVPVHPSELVWVDRMGREELVSGGLPAMSYTSLALAPDGNRLAVTVASDEPPDLLLIDLAAAQRERLTTDRAVSRPTWRPDGRAVAYVTRGSGRDEVRLVEVPSTSPPSSISLVETPRQTRGVAYAPDGASLAFVEGTSESADLRSRDLIAGRVATLLATEAVETAPAISPDGRWLAYVSDATGQDEVYVRPWQGARIGGPDIRVSSAGATEPGWAPSGGELFYREPSSGYMWAARYSATSPFAVTARERLFDASAYRTDDGWRAYDVSGAGDRFLMMRPTADAPPSTTVQRVQNVFTQLEREARPRSARPSPLTFLLTFGGMGVWIIGLGYAMGREVLDLPPAQAMRHALSIFAFMVATALLVAPLLLLEERLRSVLLMGIYGALTAAGFWWWLHARRKIADAGPTLLEVPDVGMRRMATPGVLFGVGEAIVSGLHYADPIFNATIERVGAVVVGLVLALLGLRARKAMVSFRARGIVVHDWLLEWERIEGASWSPGAEATLVFRRRRRFPPGATRVRVPAECREEVSELLDEQLGARWNEEPTGQPEAAVPEPAASL
jgi:Tol biopolymer transport system component